MPVPRGMGVPVMMLSLTPHTSSQRLRGHVSETHTIARSRPWTGPPVRCAIEEDIHRLFERRQHEHTLLEFRYAKSSNTQYLLLSINMKTRGKMSFNLLHLALEAHEVSQQHHMPNESPIVY